VKTVADTMVLRYFLAVDQFELLTKVIGSPVLVPTLVFDPDDHGEAETAQSELRRGIAYQTRRATDGSLEAEVRRRAQTTVERLGRLDQLSRDGVIVSADMTSEESRIFGLLLDRDEARKLGLAFGLHPGEAACVAMAIERRLVLATDDNDALRAYEHLAPDGHRTRIRRVLQDAAEQSLVTRDEANAIHAEIVASGFWDHEAPFPPDGG